MKARQCAGCAAPLPDSQPGTTVTCRFCGMVHDPAAPAGHGPAIRVDVRTAPVKIGSGKAAMVLGVIAALVLIPTGIGLYVAYRTASEVTRAVATATSTTPPGRTARRTADLGGLPSGHHALEVAAPPGGFAAFDPVAGLPWALAIAQAWSADARLTRIDVNRLRPDGTVNVTDDAEAVARYRFASPSKIEELRRQAELSARAELPTELWVQVQRSQPTVTAVRNSASSLRQGETLPAHPRVMASTALWTRLASRGYDAPFHNAYLIHLDREGWVWYFSSLTGEGQPRVRARDGRIWPY